MFTLLPNDAQIGLTLVIGWPEQAPVLHVVARLALSGKIQVVVAGNRFDAHHLARIVRGLTVRVDETLDRIQLARPFTCHQLMTLLLETEATTPLVFLDLLTPFYDENVSHQESVRLVLSVVAQLRRFKREQPILVTLRPSPTPERAALLKIVRGSADRVYVYAPPPQPTQPRLW